MYALNDAEEQKLSLMFEGDKNRDASSNIRGFLFQDYVTIRALLRDDAEAVCSEYLEDVNVFRRDNSLELIQVKYYPKTDPQMKSIVTDLYYQYLRMRMLRSSLKPVPRLYIHGKTDDISKPELKDLIGYLKLDGELKKTAQYPADAEAWISDNVYLKEKSGEKKDKQPEKTKQNKDEQKKSLFSAMAAEDSLKAFHDALKVENLSDIQTYKRETMAALEAAYQNPDPEDEAGDDNWPLILLGLGISFVQRRYLLEDAEPDQMRMTCGEFDGYIKEATRINREDMIGSYLVGVAAERYGDILAYNTLTDLQTVLLNRIYRNTVQWIRELSETVDGQYRLLNTLSRKDSQKVARYKKLKSPSSKLRSMAECSVDFASFLSYLWKIMLDICQQHVTEPEELEDHAALLDPRYYLDPSVQDFVCLVFSRDHPTSSMILPAVGGDPRTVALKIVDRIVNMAEKEHRPGKWFFQNYHNHEIMRGRYDYDLNMAAIKEEQTVVDLDDTAFYIECMNCININAGSWHIRDPRCRCLFCENCTELSCKTMSEEECKDDLLTG